MTSAFVAPLHEVISQAMQSHGGGAETIGYYLILQAQHQLWGAQSCSRFYPLAQRLQKWRCCCGIGGVEIRSVDGHLDDAFDLISERKAH